MRYFYSFLLYLSVPFILLRLLWRSFSYKAYRQRIAERFGFYNCSFEKCIWIHTVSVGEIIAATPFIQALRKKYPPNTHFLVTTMTPAGAARVEKIFGQRVQHVYIPYDLPDAVKRFLKTMQPKIAIMFETELWPNILAACEKNKIPVCLLNARLSAQSARGYHRIAKLSRAMIKVFSLIAAVGDKDAERFLSLGAQEEHVKVTGNIKFDLTIPPTDKRLRRVLGQERFIWIAASTHEGEEEIMIAAHQLLREKNPHSLLILVPRHPDRFEHVAKLCSAAFKNTKRHSHINHNNQSTSQTLLPDVAIYLGDTMGELMSFYDAADVAFVGGSLMANGGGHNMIEPAALGKPILMGPQVLNFSRESELFSAGNALHFVNDAHTLAENLMLLMQNHHQRTEMGKRARAIVDENRGALAKQLQYIGEILG